MDLTVEIGSIVKFFMDNGSFNPYYEEIPEGFKRPALYFPPLEVTSGGDTLETYKNNYSFFIKIFDEKSGVSYDKAMNIVEKIKAKRFKIPLFDSNLTSYNSKYLRFNNIEVRKLDQGVTQIYLSWYSSYLYDKIQVEKIQKFFTDVKMKKEE